MSDTLPTFSLTRQHDFSAAAPRITIVPRNAAAMTGDSRVEAASLAEALSRTWDWDAHFCAYEPRTVPVTDAPGLRAVVRLLHESHDDRPAVYDVLDVLDAPNVRMVAFVGDIDMPGHATPTPEWRADTEARIQASGLAYYATRGGYRVIAHTDVAITTREDAAAWSAIYLGWCEYLERTYGLVLDRACKDWTRIFRLPNVVRDDKIERAEVRGTIPTFDNTQCIPVANANASTPIARASNENATATSDMAMARARRIAETMPASIEGLGGNDALFRCTLELETQLGENAPAIYDVLSTVFNPRCVPRWDDSTLRREAQRAAERQSTPEARALRRANERAEAQALGAAAANDAAPATHPDGKPIPIFAVTQDGKEAWHYDPRTRGYLPFGERSLHTSLRESGCDGFVLIFDGKRRKSPRALLDDGPSATVLTVATDFARAGGAEFDEASKQMYLGVKCPDIAPAFDADVEAWLRSLLTDQYDTAALFIASCAQHFIGRPAIALAILGPDSIGKTLLADALAHMWGATHPVTLTTVIAQFNATMSRCPIVLDDECRALKSGDVSTDAFRNFTQEHARDIEPKGLEKRTLLGCQRFIFTGNDETDIHFNDAKPGAVKALGVRLAIVAVPDNAREAIIARLDRCHVPGSSRVDMARLCGHLAWIQRELAPRIGQERFIGSSAANAESAIVAMARSRVEQHPSLFDKLATVLATGVECKGAFVLGGRLYVKPDLFALAILDAPLLTPAGVRAILAHVTSNPRATARMAGGKKVTCIEIDGALLAKALSLSATT